MAEVREICLGSGMTSQVETRPHLPLPNDSYAQTFVSSGIVQLFCLSSLQHPDTEHVSSTGTA